MTTSFMNAYMRDSTATNLNLSAPTSGTPIRPILPTRGERETNSGHCFEIGDGGLEMNAPLA